MLYRKIIISEILRIVLTPSMYYYFFKLPQCFSLHVTPKFSSSKFLWTPYGDQIPSKGISANTDKKGIKNIRIRKNYSIALISIHLSSLKLKSICKLN